MAATALLLHPTIEECRALAVSKKMPEREGDKFFHHYNSIGWKVGRLPMKSFDSAMAGWALRWEDRGRPGAPEKPGETKPVSGAQLMIFKGEYDRIVSRMTAIKNGVEAHGTMRSPEREEFNRLLARRKELKKVLGITI